jgi:hypothetical protein
MAKSKVSHVLAVSNEVLKRESQAEA